MKKACIIFILFLFYGMSEAQVMVNVQVLPPYSTYLPDYFNYSNRVVLTLVSTTGQANIKLSAIISGDNGITVTTNPQFQPPAPIHLDQNVMVSLTGGDLQNYLDYNNANVAGIDKNTLFQGGGIPEGIYTLCIQALDYATGMSVSDPSPAGCSNPFEVKYVDPPVLISPSCGDSVSPDNQQSIVFSWVPSQGTPVTTQYKFKMVELIPPNRNPNDAMNSATTPPFYETTINSLVLVYGPSEPFLQPGHSYAWRVTAVDANSIQINNTGSLQYVNNGASEVCWFNEKTGAQPVIQVECDCHSSPVIYRIIHNQGTKRSYDAGGTYSCSGYCPAGVDATACVIAPPPVSYLWHIGAGKDVVASIVGSATGKTVELKLNGKGNFNLYVNATLTCSCKSCTGVGNLEESVIDFPPPTGCLCEIESEIIGGEPIKVVNPLAAYVKPKIKADGKPSKNQTLAVGLSVLASDNDDLIHRCILGGKWEKLIENVGDRVSYAWTIDPGTGAKIIGEKQGTAMLILPFDIKPKDVLNYRVKCTISSNADEDLTGYVNVKVSGADTCDYIKIEPTIEAMSRGTKKTKELSKTGECVPDENATWKQADPIAAILTVPAFVPVGEVTLIRLDAFDSDRVTIRCDSKRPECGNPEKTVELFEGLVFDWNDGGAGGTFEPTADGNGAIYRAPEKAGEVTITCKINDAGNHRAASGEELKVSGKIKVVDVMRALFMGLEPDSSKQQFLTVGLDAKLWPAFIKQPVPELLKSDWCLDLGGPDGMMKASLLKPDKSKKALTPADLILNIKEAKVKDLALLVSWRNHHHIHGKHPIICKTTFRFPGNEIPYIDGDWLKSNFLEEKEPEIFKLFFNLYPGNLMKFDGSDLGHLGKVGKMDDGKWRKNRKMDDDIYGEVTELNKEINIANWLLHWAIETYNPMTNNGYSLKSIDPKILYNRNFKDANGVEANAEYRWIGSNNGINKEDVIIVSDKAMQHLTNTGFKLKKPEYKFVSSDNAIPKKMPDISLPNYDLIGIETTIKCINHEMAHYEAITKNWKAGGDWEKLYGKHTPFFEWRTVDKGIPVDLTKVNYKNVTKYFNALRGNQDPESFSIQTRNKFNVLAKPKSSNPGHDKEGELHSFILTFDKVISGINGLFDQIVITIPSGWIVEGTLTNNEFNGKFIIYSQNVKDINLTRNFIGRNPPVKPEVHVSPGEIQNGIVVIGEGTKFWVYERHNDPDGDFVPNAIEDEMGTNWLWGRTFIGDYHGKPTDQEYWAEWRSARLINKGTGKIKAGEIDMEKDWANPGMQTEVEKK